MELSTKQQALSVGVVELAEKHNVMIGGDDFKSGQTKMKSVMIDFLVSAGIKPTAIVSWNHLGNNDGKNLSAPQTFRSKEISKSNVVDDMVGSNRLLYGPSEHPDHVVVIKYVPYVADSKRAMDEYTSEIFMGGTNTIVMHNTCEDSLLATPLIYDLTILAEVCERIQIKRGDGEARSNGSMARITPSVPKKFVSTVIRACCWNGVGAHRPNSVGSLKQIAALFTRTSTRPASALIPLMSP